MQTRASYAGSIMQNDTAHWLAEYSQRKRLAKLGYTSSFSELSERKAEIFTLIDIEIDRCTNEEAKKNGR